MWRVSFLSSYIKVEERFIRGVLMIIESEITTRDRKTNGAEVSVFLSLTPGRPFGLEVISLSPRYVSFVSPWID